MRGMVVGSFTALASLAVVSGASASPTIGNCDAPPEKTVFEVHTHDGPAGEWDICLSRP
jgi:hypothetical protein